METILRATVTRICNLHFPPPIQAAPSSQQYRMEPGQLHPTKDMLAVRGDALWTKWSQSQWLGYSHVPHLKLIMIPLLDIVHGYLKFKPLPRSCNILYQGPVNCSPWPNSVNKVFLGHSHALSFAYHLWLPLCYDARTEQLFQKVSGPQSWNISCQTLYRANMSTWLFEMSPVHISHTFSPLSAQSSPGTLFFLLSPEEPGFPASESVHVPPSLPETLSFMILTLWHPFTFQASDEMLIPRSPYLTAPPLQVLSQIHSFIYGIYNLLNYLICLRTCCQSAPLE